MSTQRSSLKKDDRGAILVLGVVAGALLVGALWHVAGIGDAIAWRERAQDAADAAAFENAVWNARGMNVIVAINIVMSMVLAVLVIWRTLLLLVSIALIVGAVLCVVTAGLGCGFTTAVARLETKMLEQDDKIAKNVLRILTAMSAAEVAVATATPVVGVVQSNTNTQGSYPITNAQTYSASLLPAVNTEIATKLMACFQGHGPSKGAHRKTTKLEATAEKYRDFFRNARLGIVVSLPMQEESYSALCEKAGGAVLNNLAGVLELMGASEGAIEGIDKAKGFMGAITGSLPGFFCAPIGEKGSTPAGLEDAVGTRANEACKSELEGRRVQGDTKGNDETKYRDDDGKIVTEKEYVRGCSKKKSKDAKDKLKGSFASDTKRSTGYALTECATPAKVWEWAINGNLFMRSFADVAKDKPMAERDARGLEVADGAQTGNVESLADEGVSAHAEMYFDCEGKWMDGCRGDAPWQIRWRARLRRVQPLRRLLATAIEPGIVATLSRMVEGGSDLLNSGLDKVPRFPRILAPNVGDTWYYDKLTRDGAQTFLYRRGGFDSAGAYVIRSSARSSTVH